MDSIWNCQGKRLSVYFNEKFMNGKGDNTTTRTNPRMFNAGWDNINWRDIDMTEKKHENEILLTPENLAALTNEVATLGKAHAEALVTQAQRQGVPKEPA